jgi:hypothetical protein
MVLAAWLRGANRPTEDSFRCGIAFDYLARRPEKTRLTSIPIEKNDASR